MVVPLLCLIIIAILHFGKVMNYWLDLNHVASEGARKAAVNTYATDGEYDTYAPEPARDGRAPNRRDDLDSRPPATSTSACRRARDVGDPVTVQVAAGYSLPFIGTTITLRGTATMRLEQPADVRRRREPAHERHARTRRPRGPGGRRHHRLRAMLMPVVLLFLALHRRHRQLVGAQAAPAACRSTRPPSPAARSSAIASPIPAGANTAMQAEATRFGGGAGSSYNGQVGGANTGRDHARCTRARRIAAGIGRRRRHGDAGSRARRPA